MNLRACKVTAFLCAILLFAPFQAGRAFAAQHADKVFVQCVVLQGNGYNWGATLGWLAGQVELVAARASAYEAAHPGRRAGIDLRCATGSSSGGPAVAVLDILLANPALVDQDAEWITPDEAADLSRALMFIALSTNFDGELIQLIGAGSGAWLGLLDRRSNALGGDYWRGLSTPGVNIEVFGRWVRAAGAYDPSWFRDLGSAPIPFFNARSMTLGHGEDHPAARTLDRTADRARSSVDAALADTEVAPLELGDGICATGLVVSATARPPFDYSDLRLVGICNTETFNRLASSVHLLQWLEPTEQMSTRLVLGSAVDWTALLNVTIREPELMTPLSGTLPTAPVGLGLLAVPTGPGAEGGYVASGPVIVLGGFADPLLQAWISTAILAERLATLQSRGIPADGRIAVFGRTQDRSDPDYTFAQTVMARYFTDGAASPGPSEVLGQYYDWQDEYCALVQSLRDRAKVDFYRMDWNLPGRPGAISGRSQILAAKGYNLGKVQTLRSRYPDLPSRFWETFAFDPIDRTTYLPDPPQGGMTCLPHAP
ncbi:MAG: hypothetical protein AAGG56_05955 [Pseudomonadota bacterium]